MTPQEKKRLSYERDRRNAYGENDKSSRKNIPRGKRLVSRAARRCASVALAGVAGSLNGDPDAGAVDRAEQRIADRRRRRFRKWRDEPLGKVVAWQLGRRGEADAAAAATADARVQRVEHTLGRPPLPGDTAVAPWTGQLAMIDGLIRRGDRLRFWVTRRLTVVRRAERAGAFTPYDVALQDARFVAGLHRNGLFAAVSDLLPSADTVVRACLAQIPLTQRAVRAARAHDIHRIHDTFRLVRALRPLVAHVDDPVLADELRTWCRLGARS